MKIACFQIQNCAKKDILFLEIRSPKTIFLSDKIFEIWWKFLTSRI